MYFVIQAFKLFFVLLNINVIRLIGSLVISIEISKCFSLSIPGILREETENWCTIMYIHNMLPRSESLLPRCHSHKEGLKEVVLKYI